MSLIFKDLLSRECIFLLDKKVERSNGQPLRKEMQIAIGLFVVFKVLAEVPLNGKSLSIINS